MSIFGLFKKPQNSVKQPQTNMALKAQVEKEMYINNTMGYRDTKDRLEYQNKLLDSVNKANAEYAEDGDLDAIIRVYEYAFIESNPPCKTSQNLKLVDFYLKKGFNDKAWGYLNKLCATNEAPVEKIRHEQAKILKKEKRFMAAIEMIMDEYLIKSAISKSLNRNGLIKDLGVCIRALKWNDSIQAELVGMVDSLVKKEIYDEDIIHNNLKEYFRSKGLLSW